MPGVRLNEKCDWPQNVCVVQRKDSLESLPLQKELTILKGWQMLMFLGLFVFLGAACPTSADDRRADAKARRTYPCRTFPRVQHNLISQDPEGMESDTEPVRHTYRYPKIKLHRPCAPKPPGEFGPDDFSKLHLPGVFKGHKSFQRLWLFFVNCLY